ncbi:MAG: hypothetical protein WDM87_02860 [Terracidiphilus sp.]
MIPLPLAIDASGNIWISDSITLGALSEFYATGASSGMPISGTNGDTGGGLADPWGLAVDGSGNVWLADSGTGANRISLFSAGGSAISSATGYQGGGLNFPQGIAIDGAGNVWVANRGTNATSPPYPRQRYQRVQLRRYCNFILHWISGWPESNPPHRRRWLRNVWVTNASLNSITEFVGAGAPVVTPKVANLLNPYGARAVNKP